MTELRQKQPRIKESKYLAWLRKQSCACGCGRAAPSDAAHLRAGSIKYKKEYPGLGAKPSDCWAMPLNRACHLRQHAFGDEILWWSKHGVPDPWGRSMRYYAAYFSQVAGKLATGTPKRPFKSGASKPRPHQKRTTVPRKPARKAKIAKRENPWPAKGKRKIANRKFRKD